MSARQQFRRGQRPLVAILGPTGSGKSEIGLELARLQQAEIVNCDSVQVYRYLDIGTAKLTADQRAGIPHHLIDLVNPNETFTAGEYVRRARPILNSIAASGRLPILVGGTGFYLRSLVDGLAPGPERDEALRARLAEKEGMRPGALHRILRRLDPASATRIHANDTNKLVRALEVCLLTRRPLSRVYADGRDRLQGFQLLRLILDPPREQLFERTDRRVAAMFEHGLVDEVRSLLELGYSPDCKAFESLGYKQAIQFIGGELGLREAIELTQRDTRRYAKRQWTWFRREPDAIWLGGFGDDPVIQSVAAKHLAELVHRWSRGI